MDFSYALTPFLAWLVAGVSKFAINSFKAKKLAFGLIGYGGFPSNHSAIVSSMAALIALKDGMGTPAFGVAVTLAFVVMLDANSLRQQVGKHATAINKLAADTADHQALRERIGHTRWEIAAGIAVGIAVAAMVNATLVS
ncbi:MAG TPA: divergent PAP2 family protein [Giesbergeria sp.]|uniref:divergent PAP2 family protein n=1 Tax=Acidovorax sp. 210-6 TaxID=2699468 RepID=UPI0018D85053|nr:divergent PAP2 family protein [Acidovorax sp. 210-6]HNI75179.1 divergent PAP2 family protein [Giesbergeria sp.]HNN15223.1 divergent PAP2 family protein [Giesbergeria sp.]HNN89535.1 divergent PAP2 family protein [Giesbergeria sp.]